MNIDGVFCGAISELIFNIELLFVFIEIESICFQKYRFNYEFYTFCFIFRLVT